MVIVPLVEHCNTSIAQSSCDDCIILGDYYNQVLC